MKMKLAELISSSDKKKTGKPLRLVDLAGEPRGVYSVFILEGCRF